MPLGLREDVADAEGNHDAAFGTRGFLFFRWVVGRSTLLMVSNTDIALEAVGYPTEVRVKVFRGGETGRHSFGGAGGAGTSELD